MGLCGDGNFVDADRSQRLVQRPCLVLPGLGRNMLSIKQARHNGVVSILDMDNPKLEANHLPSIIRVGERLLPFLVESYRRGRCARAGYARFGLRQPVASVARISKPQKLGPPKKGGPK